MEEMVVETSTSKTVVHTQVIHAIKEIHKDKQRADTQSIYKKCSNMEVEEIEETLNDLCNKNILKTFTRSGCNSYRFIWVLRCYQSSAIRFVDTLPHFLIRVYSWKYGADGCYRQM